MHTCILASAYGYDFIAGFTHVQFYLYLILINYCFDHTAVRASDESFDRILKICSLIEDTSTQFHKAIERAREGGEGGGIGGKRD